MADAGKSGGNSADGSAGRKQRDKVNRALYKIRYTARRVKAPPRDA